MGTDSSIRLLQTICILATTISVSAPRNTLETEEDVRECLPLEACLSRSLDLGRAIGSEAALWPPPERLLMGKSVAAGLPERAICAHAIYVH